MRNGQRQIFLAIIPLFAFCGFGENSSSCCVAECAQQKHFDALGDSDFEHTSFEKKGFASDSQKAPLGRPTVTDLGFGWRFSLDGGKEETVDLPHDWGVKGPFTDTVPSMEGCLKYYGKAVYRRKFDLPTDAGDAYLEFGGAMSRAEVYLNGCKIAERPYGYASFRVPVAEGGELEVRLDNPKSSARWYPGGGLYRTVKLRVYPKVEHVIPGTVAITTPEVTPERATVKVVYETTCGKREKIFTVEKPLLWSPEFPSLYRVELCGEEFVYGIRKIEFDPARGFFLNGSHRQMKGVCIHSDSGPLGTAVYPAALRRQLTILKEMGCDAIRTSHNPPAEELLDLCDEMGFFVMDEAFDIWELAKSDNDYHVYFKDWHRRDLADFVRRDRNHPSVVMWSVGNEVVEHNKTDPSDAIRIVTELQNIVKSIDPTRPVTCAYWDTKALTNGIEKATDIFGFNYLPERYGAFAKANPGKGLIASETCSLVSTRGFYALPVDVRFATEKDGRLYTNGFVNGQVSSYDLYTLRENNYAPDVEFAAQEANPQVYGEFVWTGFDYLGEPDPWRQNNIARSSYFGIADLCGFPKDRYYLYQSHWRPDFRMAHILPHWTWPGMEGKKIPVHVYSSGTEAELFLNGKSLGRKARKGAPYQKKPPERLYRFVWNDVTYEPGELKVVTWNSKRQKWAEDVVRTAGPAARVEVASDHASLKNDGRDLAYLTLKVVDKDGNFCPTASNRFRFEVEGPIELAGVCNGDPTDRDAFSGRTIRAFNGLAQVIVKARRGFLGMATLKIITEGLSDIPPKIFRVIE